MEKYSRIKVSIIVTVFNRSELLRKSLLSLLNQSVQADELIISDDGSEEDIVGNISDIISKFSYPVKYVNQSHKGFRLAKVRNNGVKASNGEILIFLDQDIIHTKNFIKTFIDNIKENRFVTSYPIRLTEQQTEQMSEVIIENYKYLQYLHKNQLSKIKNQFIKDYISYIGLHLGIVKHKPKLRGGVCAINRKDYFAVNGYDEKFIGWGNEDDDIRRRLYRSGVSGYNPFLNEYPIHLYHEPFHQDGKRVNKEYSNARINKINKGQFYCEFGINNPFEDDNVEVIEL